MSVWVQLFAKAVVSNFIVNQQVLCNVLQLRERLKIKIDYIIYIQSSYTKTAGISERI